MKDVVSLLLTTSCLAVAGIGIYLFSYKTDEDNDDTQKNGKKKFNGGKKLIEVEEKNHDDDSYNHDDAAGDDNDIDDKYDTFEDYNKLKVKSKNMSRKSLGKTKKNRNKFTSSKKRYY